MTFQKLIFIVLILLSPRGFTQFNPRVVIDGNASYIRGLVSADLDGDKDIDIITCSAATGTIEWYENLDGLGTFGTKQFITFNTDSPRDIFAIDIDNDGDIDVISASHLDNKIAWYENLDGLGNFGSQNIISVTATAASGVKAADLDGDGDFDVVAGCIGDKIAWYENIDGLGNFGPEQIISTSVDWAVEVYTADIDGDDDNDVISLSYVDDFIVWFENTNGQGIFGNGNIIYSHPEFIRPTAVMPEDFDGDGDIDIAYVSYIQFDTDFGVLENTTGLGDFTHVQYVDTPIRLMNTAFAADIDNDGAIDIVTSGYDDSSSNIKVAWYPNDGTGYFLPKMDIAVMGGEVYNMYMANLNNDDYIDLIVGTNSSLLWFENTGEIILNTSEHLTNTIKVYPNPTKGNLYLDRSENIVSFEVLSLTGQTLIQNSILVNNEINISTLPNGIYFLKFLDFSGNSEVKKVIKI